MAYLLILLLFAFPCFAQDGISPDTMYNIRSGVFDYISAQDPSVWCADTSAYDTSAFYGIYDTTGGGSIKWKSNEVGAFFDELFAVPMVASNCPPVSGHYRMRRLFTLFDTRTIAGMTSMEKLDSVFMRFELQAVDSTDGDSLFVVKFIPRQDSTPYAAAITDHDELVNPCNFFQCSTEVWVDGDASHWGRYGVDLSIGWNSIKLETGYVQEGDTTGIGFVMRLTCDVASETWPTGLNTYVFEYLNLGSTVDTAAFQLVYYYSPKYNDISHQDNADGISPDTIQFICSGESDSIKTPGFWRTEWLPDWNLDPNHGSHDAFHGRYRSDVTGCDTGYCASLWNYAMQPWVRAWRREPDYNDYQMTRAYFLMELEEPIPDITEIDSVRFYMQFADVNVKDGDSLHVVTYEPRHSIYGSDSCFVCYGCRYPALITPTGAWCNFWECGPYPIWGTRTASIPGRVPVYLGWKWFPIHPDIIDFGTASVGDTFGVGLVLRFEDSPAPTDTNKADIMTDPCPYIVYWFSEPETEGFINWGIRPSYLGWGLPIKQVRGAWGGGRKP